MEQLRGENMKRTQKGFSLIELLIVVAIILIIAAIAIPNLLKARIAANESAAVGTLRTWVTAAVTYESTYQNGFPPSQAVFTGAAPGTCNASDLLDNTLTNAGAVKSGYAFTYNAGTTIGSSNAGVGCANAGTATFEIDALPLVLNQTGNRSFCTDESGAIHYSTTGAAAGTDTVCEGESGL
jgi:type IV pilus assembly protein PilA